MVVTAVMLHASYRLVPWVFTLYICWSPWHYTGQNYGLLMMFARRGGAQITSNERRWLHAAFVASYVMLLASFMTGGSTDPLILSLGLPAKITLAARLVLAIGIRGAFTFWLSAADPAQRSAGHGRAADAGTHAISVVRASHAARIARGLSDSANALQQRNPGRACIPRSICGSRATTSNARRAPPASRAGEWWGISSR